MPTVNIFRAEPSIGKDECYNIRVFFKMRLFRRFSNTVTLLQGGELSRCVCCVLPLRSAAAPKNQHQQSFRNTRFCLGSADFSSCIFFYILVALLRRRTYPPSQVLVATTVVIGQGQYLLPTSSQQLSQEDILYLGLIDKVIFTSSIIMFSVSAS